MYASLVSEVGKLCSRESVTLVVREMTLNLIQMVPHLRKMKMVLLVQKWTQIQ